MKRPIFILVILFSLFFSCKNEQESDLNLKHLNNIASNINDDLKSITDDILILANAAQHKVSFDNPVEWVLEEKYHYHQNEVLFTIYEENHSAVYFPSNKKITDQLKKTIVNSEQLDSFLIEAIIKNPILSQVYFLDTNSFLRIYPYIDVINYLKSSINLTKLISYQSAKNKAFIDEKAYWVNQPFADPYGRGWIISCVEPVYYRDRFMGIIAGDIPIRTLKTKYFSSSSEMILLTNAEGKLICCTKESSKITNIPQYRDFQYFKPVVDDIFIFNSCSLTEHNQKNIRNAFKSLLSGKVKEEFFIDSKRYTVYKSQIAETDWYLFKIIN